jgi:DNA-binding NtrC family response regulator
MAAQPRVLIVDDEERFRTTLAKMLAAQGLTVTTAASGPEALESLRSQPCDVILLDIRMPKMGGVETLAEIKNIVPEAEVIILTGHASVDAAMEIMKLGAHDYLLKPCPLDELLLKIDNAFEKKLEREKRRKVELERGAGG